MRLPPIPIRIIPLHLPLGVLGSLLPLLFHRLYSRYGCGLAQNSTYRLGHGWDQAWTEEPAIIQPQASFVFLQAEV